MIGFYYTPRYLILFEVWHMYFKCVVIEKVGYCYIYIFITTHLKYERQTSYRIKQPGV
jgi:hypothetical protein